MTRQCRLGGDEVGEGVRASGDLAALVRQIRGRRVLATIAFNDAQTIAWQSALVRRYVKDAIYFIADNSTDDLVAAEIAWVRATAKLP